jgi:hypothetical protein
MQRPNVEEYRLLREELQSLKNCMTTYVGFSLVGTGASIVGLTVFALEKPNYQGLTIASITLAMIITMVLGILFYKFHSHNRYAGYCKLLAQEKYVLKNDQESLHLWEPCVSRLRQSDANSEALKAHARDVLDKNLIKGIRQNNNWVKERIEDVSGPQPAADHRKTVAGFCLFVQEFVLGRGDWFSWEFPVNIVAVFFTILLIFLASFGYCATVAHRYAGAQPPTQWYILNTAALVFLCLSWAKYFRRLYALMKGSYTVDAFCWKFMIIRHELLCASAGRDLSYEIFGGEAGLRDNEAT